MWVQTPQLLCTDGQVQTSPCDFSDFCEKYGSSVSIWIKHITVKFFFSTCNTMLTDIKHLCFCGKTKELESIRKKRGQKTEAALFQTLFKPILKSFPVK